MDLEFDFLGNPIGGHITTCRVIFFFFLFFSFIFYSIFLILKNILKYFSGE